MRQPMQISDSELILMQLIWEKGGTALFADIAHALAQKNLDWKKNTTLTFLSRLIEKGYLSISKIGRRNEYNAIVSESQYHTAQTKQFVAKVYDGDVKGLINTLTQQGFMSPEEQEELRKLWKGGE